VGNDEIIPIMREMSPMVQARPAADERSLDARIAVARDAWRSLGRRLQTVTPRALGRGVLAVTAGLVVFALLVVAWPALIPFVIGGVIAYAALPLVDALDRFMPRGLAALLGAGSVLAIIIALLAVLIPPLAQQAVAFVQGLPIGQGVEALARDVRAAVADLPPDAQDAVVAAVTEAAVQVRETLAALADDLPSLGLRLAGAVLSGVSAVIGLLVLPVWILAVLRGGNRARPTLARSVPPSWRADLLALGTLVDRSMAGFIRGQVLISAVVTGIIYLGLVIVDRGGAVTYASPLPIALFAGVSQLIPGIGSAIGIVPAVLIALARGLEPAAVYLLVYFPALWVSARLLEGRTTGNRIRLHPAILVPALVALSQIGPMFLLFSGPILAIGTGLFRYAGGRLAEPPRPAGVLPGEPVPHAAPRPAAPYRARQAALNGRSASR
jgi:predicted PurR-regulated permease PerM